MLENDHYEYQIIWSPEDNEYVGLCAEFHFLSWLAKEPEEALKGIRNLVVESVEDMKNYGEEVPEPFSTKNFSGHFVVRTTPGLHRKLSIEASEMGVSLNRHVCDKLSR
jgi:predicted HicB family RNase H-like nuclease